MTAMGKTAVRMKCVRWAGCFLIAACALGAGPTPPEEYEVLIGEGLAGSGFVIRHRGAFLGVCSRHQFDGDVPGELTPLDGEAVGLDASKVVKQKDVQVLPVQSPAADLQFLDYQPDFSLAPGDAVIVLGPAGDVVPGTLTSQGMRRGTYQSSSGPATLSLTTDHPFAAGGGSGGPVILRRTGSVIGVLLTADDPRDARTVGFETLCLDVNSGTVAVRSIPLSRRIGRAAGGAVGLMLAHAVFATVVCVPVVVILWLTRRPPAGATPPAARPPEPN